MKIIQEKDQQPVLPEKEGYVAVEVLVFRLSKCTGPLERSGYIPQTKTKTLFIPVFPEVAR